MLRGGHVDDTWRSCDWHVEGMRKVCGWRVTGTGKDTKFRGKFKRPRVRLEEGPVGCWAFSITVLVRF